MCHHIAQRIFRIRSTIENLGSIIFCLNCTICALRGLIAHQGSAYISLWIHRDNILHGANIQAHTNHQTLKPPTSLSVRVTVKQPPSRSPEASPLNCVLPVPHSTPLHRRTGTWRTRPSCSHPRNTTVRGQQTNLSRTCSNRIQLYLGRGMESLPMRTPPLVKPVQRNINFDNPCKRIERPVADRRKYQRAPG